MKNEKVIFQNLSQSILKREINKFHNKTFKNILKNVKVKKELFYLLLLEVITQKDRILKMNSVAH
jgi:hypothetical protein